MWCSIVGTIFAHHRGKQQVLHVGTQRNVPAPHERQYDLLIEGVAGTQIQKLDRDVHELDFFDSDIPRSLISSDPKDPLWCSGLAGGSTS